MDQRTAAFCHIMPKRYDEARWKSFDKTKFTDYSPAHLKYLQGQKGPMLTYEVLSDLSARFRMIEEFTDYRTESFSKYLIWQGCGWPYESTAAMARLVFSGILDDYPNLRILVHHTGAMVPFFSGRLHAMYTTFEPLLLEERGTPLKRPVLDYFRSFYADTSTFTAAAVECGCDFFGGAHVVFGTDAPFDWGGGRFSVRGS